MPLDKKGGFHINPQVGRMHDANPKPAFPKGEAGGKQRPDPGAQEGKPSHVELHKNHPEAGGKPYTTVHHHGDGAEPELRHHDSLHEAHHAMNEHTGEDGCKGEGNCEHSSSAEDTNAVGEVSEY